MSAAGHGPLARAAAWLVAPAAPEAVGAPGRAALVPAGPAGAAGATRDTARPVVAVCGLVPGAGATTLARALAAELAARDPLRSAVVVGVDGQGALPLGTPAAARLARLVSERAGVQTRPSGRLCLALAAQPAAVEPVLRGTAGIVVDVEDRRAAAEAAAHADHVVLVAEPRSEPALAEVVAASLARACLRPVVVLNRAGRQEVDPDRTSAWAGRAHLTVPASPAGARLALACRGAGGAFGAAVAALADRCGAP